MKNKRIILAASMICALTITAGCGNDNTSNSPVIEGSVVSHDFTELSRDDSVETESSYLDEAQKREEAMREIIGDMLESHTSRNTHTSESSKDESIDYTGKTPNVFKASKKLDNGLYISIDDDDVEDGLDFYIKNEGKRSVEVKSVDIRSLAILDDSFYVLIDSVVDSQPEKQRSFPYDYESSRNLKTIALGDLTGSGSDKNNNQSSLKESYPYGGEFLQDYELKDKIPVTRNNGAMTNYNKNAYITSITIDSVDGSPVVLKNEL